MRWSTRCGGALRIAVFAGSYLLLGAPTLRGEAPGGCLKTSGSRLVATELAGQDARFLAMPPGADLGYLPEPGERRTLTLPSGESVCVERESRAPGESEILAALELPDPGVTAVLLDFPRAALPEGTLRFPASGVSPPARGSDTVLWRGALEYEPGRTVALWARVRLRRETRCLRAVADLARGEILPPAKIESAVCDAAAILAGALGPGTSRGGQSLVGRAAARAIRKGEWLTEALLADEAMVIVRREATLELQSGGVRLVLPVMPEQSGQTGDRIWVRNLATRERFQAKVAGPDRLTLSLPGRERTQAAPAVASVEARSGWRIP